MDNRPIGLFDSGIGGLTVLKEVKKAFPNEEIIYLGDTKRFPYGAKTKETIIEISRECVRFLISKNVKLIIIACGTATSQSLDELRQEFEIPIIGIIEPTVLYLKEKINDKKTNIGVIATSGTIKSGVWETKLKEEIDNINIINQKAPLLATMAEEGWTNNKVAEYTIKEYMKNFSEIDIIILGCTHYPLFEELIRNELADNVEIINTGIMVAQYLTKIFKQNNIYNEDNNSNKKIQIFFTDIETIVLNNVDNIIGKYFDNIIIRKANVENQI